MTQPELERLFLFCNYGVLPAWGMLLVYPGTRLTHWIVHSVFIPILLGAVYLFLMVSGTDVPEGAGFFTLEGVLRFFDSPRLALAGWVHYLVFDLFIGAWEARDAVRRGIRRVWLAPCLLLTLIAGPVGLMLYLLVRLLLEREALLEEGEADL
ncbi:MAG TPA: ABA4-like family protein [Candidatus Limnocylindrales bacterium]|nr:ABA4-like family protein [Candidatus Limnocylindrales bacterium]